MKLAAIQYRPPKGRPDQARAELHALVGEAAEQGAKVIVCPEMATTGYIWTSAAEIGPHTEAAQGPTLRSLSGVARDHGAWVVCGIAERSGLPNRAGEQAGVNLFNSALVIDDTGELATCYRKVLLYEADRLWASAGWRRPVCQADFGTLVPGICMDINDPRFVRHLRDTQPTVLAFCTNWVAEGVPVLPYWQERVQGWSGWMVAANTWGEDRGVGFSGESAILGPGGVVLARGPAKGNVVLVAETSGL